MAVKIQVGFFRVVTQCSIVVGYESFGIHAASTEILHNVTTHKTSNLLGYNFGKGWKENNYMENARIILMRGWQMMDHCGLSSKIFIVVCEGVSKSSRIGRRRPEIQMVQLSATRCSCIAIS
jgi:hypothetical protein